jgi:hypothetical protein
MFVEEGCDQKRAYALNEWMIGRTGSGPVRMVHTALHPACYEAQVY